MPSSKAIEVAPQKNAARPKEEAAVLAPIVRKIQTTHSCRLGRRHSFG